LSAWEETPDHGPLKFGGLVCEIYTPCELIVFFSCPFFVGNEKAMQCRYYHHGFVNPCRTITLTAWISSKIEVILNFFLFWLDILSIFSRLYTLAISGILDISSED